MEKKQFQKWAQASAVLQHDHDADWFAQQYRGESEVHRSPFLYGRRQFQHFFEEEVARLPKGARILDIGCGTGDLLAQLKEQGFEVHGVEPSQKMRHHADSILPPGTVLDGSVVSLPFGDNRFDFVYSIEVLRYLSAADNRDALREIWRVLKPGGTFFGTFVNRYALDGFFLLVLLRRLACAVTGRTINCHTEFATPAELAASLMAAGFAGSETHGAMLAPLRVAYKLSEGLGAACAKLLEGVDRRISDGRLMKGFSGHLIGIGRK